MTKIKLNPTYPNDFMTLHTGHVFYKENNKLGKDAVSIDVDLADPRNGQIKALLNQGLLVKEEGGSQTIKSNESPYTMQEVKTKSNDDKIEETKEVKQKETQDDKNSDDTSTETTTNTKEKPNKDKE